MLSKRRAPPSASTDPPATRKRAKKAPNLPKPAAAPPNKPPPPRASTNRLFPNHNNETDSDADSSSTCSSRDDEEEEEWEDVLAPQPPPAKSVLPSPTAGGDLQLTLSTQPPMIGRTKKKGASAQERRVRMLTHCMHVQYLLFHVATRNHWINDWTVQAVMLSHLPPRVLGDVERCKPNEKSVVRVVGTVMHWFKRRFAVTAPGLRKHGWRSAQRVAEILGVRLEAGERDERLRESEESGEVVKGIRGMRERAETVQGSRDMGAMLFTALWRALGWEARLVGSLQPLGFGFTSVDEAKDEAGGNSEPIQEMQRKTNAKRNGKTKAKIIKQKDKKKAKTVDSSENSDSSLTEPPSSDKDESESGGFIRSKSTSNLIYGKDLQYPHFWTEILVPETNTWLSVDPLILTIVGSSDDVLSKFEPKGKKAADAKQVIAYVIAFSSDGSAKDLTSKYLSHQLPGKTKGFRVPVREVPIYNANDEVVATQRVDWFAKVLRGWLRPLDKRTEADKIEDELLQQKEEAVRDTPKKKAGSESIAGYKNHPDYILERHLKREEAVRPGRSHVKTFTIGKGDKAVEEKVYTRSDIAVCKAVEHWTKEGRKIKVGEQPLKEVKRRAVTLNRKREIEDKQREGETVMQGLYSKEQTKLYIPPPIVDGKIPRNAFGNIDAYVPTLIPQGAVHLPLKGSAKVARALGIDYAEAVTGFEFKKQRAVPYVDGIVIAEEFEDLIRDAWREAEEEKRKREEGRREKEALDRWRRFVLRLRVLKRIREEYADFGETESVNPFEKAPPVSHRRENVAEVEGGFIGDEGGGFVVQEEDVGGGFILDEEPITHGFSSRTPTNGDINTSRAAMSLQDMLALRSKDDESASMGGGFVREIDDSEEAEGADSSTPVQTRDPPGGLSTRSNTTKNHIQAPAPDSSSDEEGRSLSPEITSKYFSTPRKSQNIPWAALGERRTQKVGEVSGTSELKTMEVVPSLAEHRNSPAPGSLKRGVVDTPIITTSGIHEDRPSNRKSAASSTKTQKTAKRSRDDSARTVPRRQNSRRAAADSTRRTSRYFGEELAKDGLEE